MDNNQIEDTLRDVLGVAKAAVALKVWPDEPQGIRKYTGTAFPGMCTQIGEVLAGGETFYTTRDQHFCTGGVVATGVAPPLSKQEKKEMLEVHFQMSRSYRDIETALGYEHEMEGLMPRVGRGNAAVQLGPFRKIKEPDLVLLFCTPGAADILSRAYCYVSGEPIRGFGGNGGCPFLIQYPYVAQKPSFSYSDVAWRKYAGLADEELTMSFPYQCLASLAGSLACVAEQYRRYGEAPEE